MSSFMPQKSTTDGNFAFESVDWRSMGMSEGLELCLCGSEGSM